MTDIKQAAKKVLSAAESAWLSQPIEMRRSLVDRFHAIDPGATEDLSEAMFQLTSEEKFELSPASLSELEALQHLLLSVRQDMQAEEVFLWRLVFDWVSAYHFIHKESLS